MATKLCNGTKLLVFPRWFYVQTIKLFENELNL